MKTRFRIGVLAAYVAVPLFQSLHHAHEAEHAVCTSCATDNHSEGSVSVRCAGGCGETEHHHHDSPHRHGECTICKASSGGIIITACASPVVVAGPVASGRRLAGSSRAESPRRSHRPRSPPAAS